MVINIPSESEASDATFISSFLIAEEVKTQLVEGPQSQQPTEIDAMERKRKPQTIPTPCWRHLPPYTLILVNLS